MLKEKWCCLCMVFVHVAYNVRQRILVRREALASGDNGSCFCCQDCSCALQLCFESSNILLELATLHCICSNAAAHQSEHLAHQSIRHRLHSGHLDRLSSCKRLLVLYFVLQVMLVHCVPAGLQRLHWVAASLLPSIQRGQSRVHATSSLRAALMSTGSTSSDYTQGMNPVQASHARQHTCSGLVATMAG